MASPDAQQPSEKEGQKVSPERGKRIYSEVGSRKARKVRLMLWLTSLLEGIGASGTAIIVMILVFVTFEVPIYLQAITALLGGVFLYWAFLAFVESSHLRKGLKPLKVYELGLRPPCGSKKDLERGRPPRFIAFKDIEVFFPNEGQVNLPEFVILVKDPKADPLVASKELVGNWGRFRKAVKDKMAVRKGWVYLKNEGAMYAGRVDSDDLHLFMGPKEEKRRLSWDNISDVPKIKHKVHKSLVVLTVPLRKGGELKFLIPLEDANSAVKNYRSYINRFWKSPEEEEERWEKVEDTEEDEDEI